MAVNFENAKDSEEMRRTIREAREALLEKAERDYEKRKAKKELAKLKGEDKWMLPELEAQLTSTSKEKKSKKAKKEKKHKKDKKHKKSKKKDESSDSDEWVEKPAAEDKAAPVNVPLQREDWMSVPTHLPTFSKNDLSIPKRTSLGKDEEAARKTMMEKPGQTSRELNPYWKDGGTGLPPAKTEAQSKTESPERKKMKSSHGRRDPSRSRSRSPERRHSHHHRKKSPEVSRPRFRRPSEEESSTSSMSSNRQRFVGSSSQPSWKKAVPKAPVSASSSSSSSSSESDKEEEEQQPAPSIEDEKVWTEQELNALNAKLIKAEIMGQQDLVNSIKKTLTAARESTARRSAQGAAGSSRENVAILTRMDARGGQHPLPAPRYGEESLQGAKGKGKKIKAETHQKGERVRYFADDDKYSLNQMYQRERMDTAEDQNAMFSRLAGNRIEKTNDDFDIDDMFESRANREVDSVAAEAKERSKAIAQHEKREKVLDTCAQCLDSNAIQKHLIIAIGQKCYLSLPSHQSLVDGHCFIVPRTHVTCSTQLDEDVWAEMQLFRQALTKMFDAQEADAIFFEKAVHLKRFPHMVLECVPLPISAGETAPIYFKKALLECESEWAMNKKVVDLKGKDVRKCVPKGLPYFVVDFGMQSGFAHVVEDEHRFPDAFAQEIIGGILDLEPQLWRRPRRENFDQQKKKVLEFAAQWKEYDIISKGK